MNDLLLAIDVGTTNVKAAVVDPRGRALRLARRKLGLLKPEPGAALHDPSELLRAAYGAAREAVRGFEERVAGVALTSYLFGLMPLGEGYRPLHPMIT